MTFKLLATRLIHTSKVKWQFNEINKGMNKVIRKSDWSLIREAESQGLMVAMTSVVERNRTELNKALSDYFKKQNPNYSGSFDEEQCEEILEGINEYIEENQLDKHRLDFPITSGTEIELLPINDNIQLKVLISDEYHGDGDYSKYVMIDFFLINDKATEKDVDGLTEFIQKYLSI